MRVKPPKTPSTDQPKSALGAEGIERCPVCKTDKYLNPKLRLLVSPCYHRIFNKRLEDFGGNLRAYNDYLEEVEELIFNLVNDTDVQAMNARIEEYQRENSALIEQNLEKLEREDQAIRQILQEDTIQFRMRKEADLHAQQRELQDRADKRQQIIDQLAHSSHSASSILNIINNDQTSKAESAIDAQSRRGPSLLERLAQFQSALDQTRAVADAAPEVDAFGDPLDTEYTRHAQVALKDRYMDPVATSFDNETCRAGGFYLTTVYQKAIQSITQGLFVDPIQ